MRIKFFSTVMCIMASVMLLAIIANIGTAFLRTRHTNREYGVDLHNTFKVAYIRVTPDECRKVYIKTWRDWEADDCIQIVDTNDVTYLTVYDNVVMLSEDK